MMANDQDELKKSAATQNGMSRLASLSNTYPGNQLPGQSGSSSAVGAKVARPGINTEAFGASNRLAQIPQGIGGNPAAPPRQQQAAPSPVIPAVAQAQAPETSAVARLSEPAPINRTPSPGNTFPGNRLQGASGSSGAPVPTPVIASPAPPVQAAPPVRAPAPGPVHSIEDQMRSIADKNAAGATYGLQPPDVRGMAPPVQRPSSPSAFGEMLDDRGNEVAKNFSDGNYMRGLGTAARTLAQAPGMAVMEAGQKSLAPIGEGVSRFVGGLFGTDQQAQPAAVAPGQVAAPVAAPAVPAQASINSASALSQSAGGGRAVTAPQVQTTGAPSPAQVQMMSGVYQHGRGQYSDNSAGMGLSSTFTGQPSAQNMKAADRLASSGMSAAGVGTAVDKADVDSTEFQAPTARHSGNDWQSRQHLKNLETSASSITNTRRWGGKGAENSADVQNFVDGQRADAAARGQQIDADLKTMGVNAGIARERMGQKGATARAAMVEAGANERAQGQLGLGAGRLRLDEQRAASEDVARAPQIRAAERMATLQDQFMGAKTEEERSRFAGQMRALNGQAEQADWKVHATPATKNVDGSSTAGQVLRYNTRTGQVQQVDGARQYPEPTAANIQALKSDPKHVAMFEERFGPGSASRHSAN